MKFSWKSSLVSLIIVLAVMGLIASLTSAMETLQSLSLEFFSLAALFFIASILFWVISWAYLIKKKHEIGYVQLIIVGFRAVFGALTPVQLGAEALRSLQLKKHFNVRYTDSIAASMMVKGLKFLLIALLALAIISLYLVQSLGQLDAWLLLGFLSGFLVILLATALFLLPLHPRMGSLIARFFHKLAKAHHSFARLGSFFENYSAYLGQASLTSFLVVFILSFISLVFEFLALQYSFLALGIDLPLTPVIILLVLVSVLERTPFLPRGIGVVELVGYYFLTLFPLIVLSVSAIGAVIVVYDVVRLVIPTLLSMFFYLLFRKF
jgi:uncharacterized protein (TIRG00374 family)